LWHFQVAWNPTKFCLTCEMSNPSSRA
jgi:hypothetical protein